MKSVVGKSVSCGDPTGNVAASAYRIDTSLVLCLACGLIVNSHLERFWPRSYLAFDGLLGNSLFYFLSGFGIGSSLFSRPQRFGSYLARRLVRIYPGVFVTGFVFATVAGGYPHATVARPASWTVEDVFHWLIWPTPFTYLRNIVAIYVIGYCVALPRSSRILRISVAISISVFVAACVCYRPALAPDTRLKLGGVPTSVYDSFDTALFLYGMLVCCAPPTPSLRPWPRGLLAVALFAGYCALKYGMVVIGVAARFYWILFILVGVMSYLFLAVLSDPAVVRPLKRAGWISWAVDLVAGHTLEIYLIHQSLIAGFPDLAIMPFPLNIGVFVLVAVVSAILLRKVTEPLRKWVDKLTMPVAVPLC